MSALTPSQRARDAAGDFDRDRLGYETPYQAALRAGEHDDHTVVQAFARFEAETLEAAAKRIEELRALGPMIFVPSGEPADLQAVHAGAIVEALSALRNHPSPDEQEPPNARP